jgi:gas vesicle protein
MGKGNGGGGGFVVGFLIGAVLGGVAAVLLTQEETRDLLAGKAREAGNRAMDATGDLRGKVGDVTSQWQSSVSELYERGRQVVENARANIDAAVAEGRAAADEAQDELARKAEG